MIGTATPSGEAASPTLPMRSKGSGTVFAVFRLGASLFAVNARKVKEIAFMAHLSSPAGLPSLLAGFLNLAQQPIPIIRLHRLLDVPEVICGLYTQILILRENNGISAGWLVDEVTHMVPLAADAIMAVPANQCFKDCSTGTFSWQEDVVTILDPDRVLLEKERESLRQFQVLEQMRLGELENTRE